MLITRTIRNNPGTYLTREAERQTQGRTGQVVHARRPLIAAPGLDRGMCRDGAAAFSTYRRGWMLHMGLGCVIDYTYVRIAGSTSGEDVASARSVGLSRLTFSALLGSDSTLPVRYAWPDWARSAPPGLIRSATSRVGGRYPGCVCQSRHFADCAATRRRVSSVVVLALVRLAPLIGYTRAATQIAE
jgi:hypothetical protein